EFPEVSGDNLDGETVYLPDDFDGDPTLVCITFKRKLLPFVEEWIDLAERLAAEYDGLTYYQLAVLRRMNRLSRSFLERGLHSDVTDPERRGRTVPIYTHKPEFREALDLGGEDTIYVLLVENGKVVWSLAGEVTGPATETFETALQRLTAPKW
ncbi:MAG: hypothetical protein ACQETI_06210, partial [Halobacteriota archaeon]